MSATLHNPGAVHGDYGAALYVVTIAGSAGAFGPLTRLLAELPRDLNAAVATILHTGPGSHLAAVLRQRSSLPVEVAVSGKLLRRGHVYVAAPRTHLIINPDATTTVSVADPVRLFRPSGDWLFESAAASFGRRHVAVVLSGMLSDCAARLYAVKQRGGTVLVQSPRESQYASMPEAAIATGCVDAVVGSGDMAAAICRALSTRDLALDSESWITPFAAAAS